MNNILFFQSLWAMELRSERVPEPTLEENIAKIVKAGYDGVAADWRDREYVRKLHGMLRAHALTAEAQCYPATVDELKATLENATEFGVHHLTIQPNARPRHIKDCIPLLEGWQRLAEEVDFPVYVETHRDRMTTDLYFTLDLIDALPNLKLLGDISHYVVGREFPLPISNENQTYIHQILDHAWAFHGRVASREQVQIELTFPQHQIWLDQFLSWWEYGFRSWRRRATNGETLAFTCELGPKPYAITGRDGEDTTDRWSEALLLRTRVREVWDRSGDDNIGA